MYDVVVMFQSYCPIEVPTFSSLHPNVVFVPMLDQIGLSHDSVDALAAFWAPFHGSKVLSFSAAVHTLAMSFGIVSHFARYYPEVPTAACAPAATGLRGFFWLRREMELDWRLVRTLISRTQFETFHLHAVGDPGFPRLRLPPNDDLLAYNITITNWFEDKAEFESVVREANVYFAPRLSEGIGQSFLEAMGRGQCVVAPDSPTMNEYIIHGVNGILYDPRRPSPVDFAEVARLGDAARRGARVGRKHWDALADDVVDFILTPSHVLYGHPREASAKRVTRSEAARTRRLDSSVAHAVRSMSRRIRAALRRRTAE
jgi:hypothetical protein